MKYRTTYISPIGTIYLESNGIDLTTLSFQEQNSMIEAETNCDLPIFQETMEWLNLYFSGKNPSFIPKYKIEGVTSFQLDVIKEMVQIPYGKTITYGAIASIIAKKRGIQRMSAQAVGGAVGRNPIGIIIPCHRVVGRNGNLTGYNGGLNKKVELLQIEGNDMSQYFFSKKGDSNGKTKM